MCDCTLNVLNLVFSPRRRWCLVGLRRVAEHYSHIVNDVAPDTRSEDLARAAEYNATHGIGPTVDLWSGQKVDETPEYLSQLSATDTMAQIVIPKINVNLPIYYGTSDEVLDKGIGHLYGPGFCSSWVRYQP